MPIHSPIVGTKSRIARNDENLVQPNLEQRLKRLNWPVALVCMPFGSATRPSLPLGILKPLALRLGFPTTTFHLNIDLAAAIGLELYELLGLQRGWMVGDWLFSREAFGDLAPDKYATFLDEFDDRFSGTALYERTSKTELRHIREHVIPKFLDDVLRNIKWANFKIVGFTSTFQQNCASFALARRLKEQFPAINLVFGGAIL